jgi:hypothetical protein
VSLIEKDVTSLNGLQSRSSYNSVIMLIESPGALFLSQFFSNLTISEERVLLINNLGAN